ncbi:macro domain-containing protein [Mucilaginibacter polytrichastri]|nr:macro domain-containing protein [Mucilaginibacter polytrichastri]SFT02907.1 O-acetyl-ADP-ribose deacetylase (regulator of RNase III), contains Macro domain [Mucilaginibacter polytrichastri]SFT23642.1 O-acetyl-ADP-ribose deacetylase (regulator of RNase III), contains Macro domain [Mucilaginibacter polytrichastri]SFT27723.1 O-acetyl-ADP-ribose deacetylase (regulator of RNase III), contains Macro domain [Mucilaginibacter polytrichastri]
MITYTTGDLLADTAPAVVNTVNTGGAMGKGIALQFREAFPHNYHQYRLACRNGKLSIGQLLAVRDCNLIYGERLIINLPTKTHWRLPSEYNYIETGLTALREFIVTHQLYSLAMPAPGCGNGGLDWAKVRPIIERRLGGLDCHIIVYEPGN